ncbi:PEP-CTERM sorting domain-containing protein [Geomonas subterranea]|uniref:PEP-CTERM sorting domain-containing protein n=1 Tax=Geomonas subterranea TaxID=2847989 RepID=UPI001CD48147|nr:PEP-CTERM sorting domain-containing protein [Geomonas fuzhouensis]
MKSLFFGFLFFGLMTALVKPAAALVYADTDAYYSIGDVSVTLPNGALVTRWDSGWDDPNCEWVSAAGLGVADLGLVPQWPTDLHLSGTVGANTYKNGADMVWFSVKGGESGTITFNMPYTLHAELVGWPEWAENTASAYALADISFSYYTYTRPYGARSPDVWLREYDMIAVPSATPGQNSMVSGVLSLSIPYDATLGYTTYGYFSDSVGLSIPEPVPEPSTILFFGAGLGGLALWRKKQQLAVR